MATLTIRDLPDDVRDKLRIRAAENGRSMEAEVRTVLAAAVSPPAQANRQAEWESWVKEAQKAFAPFRNPKILASDELIAERRLEAWTETVEANEWLSRNAHRSLG